MSAYANLTLPTCTLLLHCCYLQVMGRILAASRASTADTVHTVDDREVPLVLDQCKSGGESLVAVVDPPRGGLHSSVIRALRACSLVRRIVYVSCNPKGSLIENGSALCGPKSKAFKGQPFRPVRAIPVDLFPHTAHCEMVMVFER